MTRIGGFPWIRRPEPKPAQKLVNEKAATTPVNKTAAATATATLAPRPLPPQTPMHPLLTPEAHASSARAEGAAAAAPTGAVPGGPAGRWLSAAS
jgi:hypothetical protein